MLTKLKLWRYVPRLQHASCHVRRTASKVLGGVRDPRCVELLIPMLGDVDSDVRRVAAQALAKLGEPKWQEIIKGDESDRANQSADVIEPLLRALGDSGMLARYRHLRNTGQWRDSDGGLLILELTRQRM